MKLNIQPTKMRLAIDLGQPASSDANGDIFATADVDLSDHANWAELVQLFDEYKLISIKLWQIPRDPVITGYCGIGVVHNPIDEVRTAPASLNALVELSDIPAKWLGQLNKRIQIPARLKSKNQWFSMSNEVTESLISVLTAIEETLVSSDAICRQFVEYEIIAR